MSTREPQFVINNSNFEKKNFSNQNRNFSLISKSKFFNCSFEYTLLKETKLNDVIFKGLLFMSMGAVLHMTGKINGTDLGGLYKSMPITTTLCIIGAASISAFPLFSGFVSKSMVMAAAAQEGHTIVFLLLLFASAGVFHHAGIQIPYFAFFAHDSGIRTQEPPLNMLAAMGIAAALCIFNGVYPWALYSILPWDAAYQPYTWSHVISQTQLLFFSALAFALLMISGLYPPELRSVNLDVDWLYRKVGFNLGKFLQKTLAEFWNTSTSSIQKILNGLIKQTKLLAMPNGVLAKTWSTGTGTSWMLIILAISLLILFFA